MPRTALVCDLAGGKIDVPPRRQPRASLRLASSSVAAYARAHAYPTHYGLRPCLRSIQNMISGMMNTRAIDPRMPASTAVAICQGSVTCDLRSSGQAPPRQAPPLAPNSRHSRDRSILTGSGPFGCGTTDRSRLAAPAVAADLDRLPRPGWVRWNPTLLRLPLPVVRRSSSHTCYLATIRTRPLRVAHHRRGGHRSCSQITRRRL